jgi:hypothetical protein
VIRSSPDATTLHEAWHDVWNDLEKEKDLVPEVDRRWLLGHLSDLQLHVYNSPQWRQSLEAPKD